VVGQNLKASAKSLAGKRCFGLSTPYCRSPSAAKFGISTRWSQLRLWHWRLLFVLLEASPMLVGLSLGLALLAPSPILLIWVFLLGLFWQIHKRQRDGFRCQMVQVSLLTAGPIVLIGLAFLCTTTAASVPSLTLDMLP